MEAVKLILDRKMGTLSLECPLCCTEKFSTLHGLKHHLLGIIDKLACSSCNQKFESVRELIKHLDVSPDRECCGSSSNGQGTPIKKEEEDVEEVIEKSILAKALLKKPEEQAEQMEETQDLTESVDEVEGQEQEVEIFDEELLYECSTCQMQFPSIEEHIRDFHEGTEVVLQVSKVQKVQMPF